MSVSSTKAQKCWAHLILKAIKRKLQDSENRQYQTFAESLLNIYHKACRIKRDGRFGDTYSTKSMLAT